MCLWHHLAGKCKKPQNECQWSHDPGIKLTPEERTIGQKEMLIFYKDSYKNLQKEKAAKKAGDGKKTEVCRNWQQGKCKKSADECRYLHANP